MCVTTMLPSFGLTSRISDAWIAHEAEPLLEYRTFDDGLIVVRFFF